MKVVGGAVSVQSVRLPSLLAVAAQPLSLSRDMLQRQRTSASGAFATLFASNGRQPSHPKLEGHECVTA